MGAIARGISYVYVIQVLINQVLTQQQPVTQYLLSNYGQATNNLVPRPIQPGVPNLPPSVSIPPTTPLNKPPSLPKPELCGPLDSNVLNNLAIALQLLIVSNIMNIPTEPERFISTSRYDSLTVPNLSKNEFATPVVSYLQPSIASYVEQALSKPGLYSYEAQPKPTVYSYEAQPVAKPSFYSYEAPALPKPMYSYEAQSLPNANFLGSSGFAEPVFGSTLGTVRPNPRSSMTLMSPYDALGTSSFADPSSSFPTSYSKKDFQSPYASIMAADGAKDLFSADFF